MWRAWRSLIRALTITTSLPVAELYRPWPRESARSKNGWRGIPLPMITGYDLWISTADLPKVGYKIVEPFPERKIRGTINAVKQCRLLARIRSASMLP